MNNFKILIACTGLIMCSIGSINAMETEIEARSVTYNKLQEQTDDKSDSDTNISSDDDCTNTSNNEYLLRQN